MGISLILNVLGFVFYIFAYDMYQGFELPAIGGGTHYIELDQDSLNYMMLIKAILCILIFIQVKGGLDIVNPLMKEYRQAQTGATQGIAMT